MNATCIGFGEATQIHQHGLAILDQTRQGSLPGIGMTEEIVDAETTIRIAHVIAFGETVRERGPVAHEMTVELAAEKSRNSCGWTVLSATSGPVIIWMLPMCR